MKRFEGVFAVLCLVFACFFVLVGCQGSSTEDSKEFIGEWTLESVTAESNDMKVSASDVALMQSFGYTATLTLREDGTATFDVFGEITDCEWSAKDSTTAQLNVNDEKVDLTIDEDGTLVMSQGGRESICFVRSEKEPQGQEGESAPADQAASDASGDSADYSQQQATGESTVNDGSVSASASSEGSDGTSDGENATTQSDGAVSTEADGVASANDGEASSTDASGGSSSD